jgi:hypothetical protein
MSDLFFRRRAHVNGMDAHRGCLDGVWFAIERFGLFYMFLLTQGDHARRNGSFWVGVSFILFGAIVAALSHFTKDFS